MYQNYIQEYNEFLKTLTSRNIKTVDVEQNLLKPDEGYRINRDYFELGERGRNIIHVNKRGHEVIKDLLLRSNFLGMRGGN